MKCLTVATVECFEVPIWLKKQQKSYNIHSINKPFLNLMFNNAAFFKHFTCRDSQVMSLIRHKISTLCSVLSEILIKVVVFYTRNNFSYLTIAHSYLQSISDNFSL